MCVVNKQFELPKFVSESVYVDLQYDEISLTFTAGPAGSKRHSLQAVYLSQRTQAAVQIVSNLPPPAMGARFTYT